MRLSGGAGAAEGAAEDALAALPAGSGSVEVTGDGALAAALRARLGARLGVAAPQPPRAAIDTTGDPAVIGDLLARVADLGTVVLAGPPPAGGVELDLYRDVHVRGLTVTGLAVGAAVES